MKENIKLFHVLHLANFTFYAIINEHYCEERSPLWQRIEQDLE